MEALKLSRTTPLTTTIRAAEGRRSDGGNIARKTSSSLQIPRLCSGGGSTLNENGKAYGVFASLASRKLIGVQDRLFQNNRHGESRKRWCASNDNSQSSAVTVVSEDDVEIHRKELLKLYLDDGFQIDIHGETEDETEDEDEDDDDNERLRKDPGDEFTTRRGRRRAAARASLYTALGLEEDHVPEKTYWWMRLAVHVRRKLTPRTKGILLLNILTFFYGSNISIIKKAGETMDPTLFSVGRFAIASLAFAPFLSHALSDKRLRESSVELGLLASSGYLTQCISVLTSDAARVSFISTFTVIVVPLLAGLSGAKISKITWIAAATALIGVGILESNGSPFAIGDVWSFVSAVMFGVHMLRTEHHSKTLAHEDSLPVMALQLVVITLCSGVWFGATHLNSGDLLINLPISNWSTMWDKTVSLPWLPMLYTGLLSTAFCLWTELVSMRDVKATEAAVIYTTEPLWGAAFAWLTLGERWGPNGWLGAFFILGGSLTMQIFGQPESPPRKIVFPPFSAGDEVHSIDENNQPPIRTEASDAGTEVFQRQKPRIRKHVPASRNGR